MPTDDARNSDTPAPAGLRFDDAVTDPTALIALFRASFTDAEGASEGQVVAGLVRRLLDQTPAPDLRLFTACDDGGLAGAVIFSRLTCAGGGGQIWLLSPMAVATSRQGQGVGQALIRHALDALRGHGTDLVMTYGDPAFYGKVGFRPVSTETVPAPFALSQPQGWIGQMLNGGDIPRLAGPVSCVAALNDASLW